MSKKNKIGWQKYEDLLEKQINSPLIDMIAASILKPISINKEIDYPLEYEKGQEEYQESDMSSAFSAMPEDLSNEIQMITNFDCWLGHTNFNITKSLKDRLENIRGVEVLKICSRYRFFIGVGRMFDFSNVRKEIEESFI
tara:strand:- start:537 stop:956 length:420 start_codon:yes stop_codon:yes gene_type:complete